MEKAFIFIDEFGILQSLIEIVEKRKI